MQFSTQASTLLAVLCLSGPALASIVNAAPIPAPEPFAMEARDPSWVSAITDTVEDVKNVGSAVGDAMNIGDTVVNEAKNLWNDVFHNNSPPPPQQTQPTQ
jgi:hypothetical protein